nr:putative reverse transcriptase domain-containing protein [Tanacetum cinerariifolium]
MCDKINSVLFTGTECLVLSPDFKLPDENQVLYMYSFDLKNVVPSGERKVAQSLFQLTERDLSNKSDVVESASDSGVNESEENNDQANDRYKAGEGYHAVPPPYTGNFMPPKLNMSFAGLDDSIFKYAISEPITSVHETKTSTSKTSKERKFVFNNDGKATGQREVRTVWNNAKMLNPQNFSNNLTYPHPRRNFVPASVITNSCKVPINTAKQISPRATASTSTTRYINTAANRPTVKGNVINHISKDWGSYMLKRFNYVDLQGILKLDDAEGTACLSNAAIFEELARMGAKTIAWNEFSSTMASAIICMANNQKFNFSKYIHENMVKNLEAEVKFFMYPRFIQVFVNHQIGDMLHHEGIFVNPSLTKKVFANMRRVDTHILTQPSTSQTKKKHKPRRKQRKETEVSHDEIPTEKRVPTPSHDRLPSGEDRLQLNELMEIHTKLSDRVLSLEQTKTNQAAEIEKLEKRRRIAEIDADEDLSLINETAQDQGRMNDQDLFGVHDLNGDEMFVDVTIAENVEQDAIIAEKEVTTIKDIKVTDAATTQQISKDKLTLTQTLMEIKEAKPKAKGVTIQKPKPEKPLKKKDQITLDKVVARKLEAEMKAELDEEEWIARERNEANLAMIEEWDDVQAIIDANRQLAEQIQAQEREQLSIKERSKLLAELIESRRKYFATKRAEEIRNKPPTKAQQKSLMCTYMKNIEGYKQKDFNGKSFDDIKKMFDKLKRCLEIIPKDDDDVEIKATLLSSKSPTMVDYKIYREGKKSYIKIIRADGNSQNYLTFRKMFKNFNREDLEVLRSMVKEWFKKTKPVDDIDNLLFQTSKIMFEYHVEDIIWKYQQGAVKIAGTLTDEALRNGSIKKYPEKRGNRGEPSKDRYGREDNKRNRTENDFATTTNPVRRENTGAIPKCTTCKFHHPPETPCRTCFKCNCPRHFAKDCKVVPRNLNPINARNPTTRAYYEFSSTDDIKATCTSGSFDMIIGMYWLSNHKAKIIYHMKVVRIPLPDDKVLRVIRERPKEKMRHLRSVKTKEQKQEEIVVVRDYAKVFPDDPFGLAPIQEIKFQMELVPGTIPIMKSPYRLAPSEMDELPGQLKEL